jgi:hypothetical protein
LIVVCGLNILSKFILRIDFIKASILRNAAIFRAFAQFLWPLFTIIDIFYFINLRFRPPLLWKKWSDCSEHFFTVLLMRTAECFEALKVQTLRFVFVLNLVYNVEGFLFYFSELILYLLIILFQNGFIFLNELIAFVTKNDRFLILLQLVGEL